MTCIGSMTDAERALEVKSERKKTLGRPWRKWQENIEMGLTENESVLQNHLVPSGSGQEHVSGFCKHEIKLRIPQNGNFLVPEEANASQKYPALMDYPFEAYRSRDAPAV